MFFYFFIFLFFCALKGLETEIENKKENCRLEEKNYKEKIQKISDEKDQQFRQTKIQKKICLDLHLDIEKLKEEICGYKIALQKQVAFLFLFL